MAVAENRPGIQAFLAVDKTRATLQAKAEANRPVVREVFSAAYFALMKAPVIKIDPRSRDDNGHYATRVFRKKNPDGTTTQMRIESFPGMFASRPVFSSVNLSLSTRVSETEVKRTVIEIYGLGKQLFVNHKDVTYNSRLLAAAGNIIADISGRIDKATARAGAKKAA